MRKLRVKVCGNGHFVVTRRAFCSVCLRDMQTCMSLYEIDEYTRMLLPGVFRVR